MLYKKGQIITREQFLEATIKDISQVYEGKRDCCRCGCGGEYYSTSYATHERSNIDDKYVEGLLNRAKEIIKSEQFEVDYSDSYVDVECGWNKTLTFYFDEVK